MQQMREQKQHASARSVKINSVRVQLEQMPYENEQIFKAKLEKHSRFVSYTEYHQQENN
jgi:hypothetical protein